jgi:hypothetical protein
MIVSLRHFSGWMVSACHSRQDLVLENLALRPRRLNDSARFSLIVWSRLCNWKEAAVQELNEGAFFRGKATPLQRLEP